MKKQQINLSELQFYINILEDLNDKQNYSNYDSLCKDLLVNFGIRITKKEYLQLLEPTAEELAKDLEIMYRNVC